VKPRKKTALPVSSAGEHSAASLPVLPVQETKLSLQPIRLIPQGLKPASIGISFRRGWKPRPFKAGLALSAPFPICGEAFPPK
jgi:hypothetical protein